MNSPTILVSTWGYEQTNVTFYLVQSQTTKTCTLVPIGKRQIVGDSWEGLVMPDPEVIKGAPMRRKLRIWNGRLEVKVESGTYAWLWDGRPARFSGYA